MKLIVMLTHNDMTVKNAREIFRECAKLPVQDWGFKDVGLPVDQMKLLVKEMKEAGKTTYLEVVSYTEEECLAGAKLAIECNFDYLMGTLYYPSVLELIQSADVKYFPFCGKVWGSPSVLGNTEEEIIDSAAKLEDFGVAGCDLLAYRFIGDPEKLIRDFMGQVTFPVVIAGSINSFARLDFMKEIDPWGFTIGSAFFTKSFVPDGSFRENLIAAYYYAQTGMPLEACC